MPHATPKQGNVGGRGIGRGRVGAVQGNSCCVTGAWGRWQLRLSHWAGGQDDQRGMRDFSSLEYDTLHYDARREIKEIKSF